MASDDPQPKATSKQDHAERAAAALRENLRKRKAQQRERAGKAAAEAEEEKEWGK